MINTRVLFVCRKYSLFSIKRTLNTKSCPSMQQHDRQKKEVITYEYRTQGFYKNIKHWHVFIARRILYKFAVQSLEGSISYEGNSFWKGFKLRSFSEQAGSVWQNQKHCTSVPCNLQTNVSTSLHFSAKWTNSWTNSMNSMN